MDTDTITQQTEAANKFDPEPLDFVCDMEEPLRRVFDLLTALMHLDAGDLGNAVSTISELARDDCQHLEELRGKLFHDLHPNREAAR